MKRLYRWWRSLFPRRHPDPEFLYHMQAARRDAVTQRRESERATREIRRRNVIEDTILRGDQP